MSNDKNEKQTRTPRQYDSILAGALSLPMGDKVALIKELKASVQAENDEKQAAAKASENLVKDL